MFLSPHSRIVVFDFAELEKLLWREVERRLNTWNGSSWNRRRKQVLLRFAACLVTCKQQRQWRRPQQGRLQSQRFNEQTILHVHLTFFRALIKEIKQQRLRPQRKNLNSAALCQTSSLLFYLVQFAKWWRIFPGVKFQRTVSKFTKRKRKKKIIVLRSIPPAI